MRFARRMTTLASVAIAAALVYGCGPGGGSSETDAPATGSSEPAAGAGPATTAPQTQPVSVQRYLQPLAEPAEAPARVRHGGLVARAGDAWIEMVASSDGARVYLTDDAGESIAAGGGEVVATWKDGKATIALKPDADGLAGSYALPDRFTAEVRAEAGGKTYTATLHWSVGGASASGS